MTCVFCEVAAGRKGEEVLFEDGQVVVFLDRYRQPSAGGHLLVIPRRHVEAFWDLPEELELPLIRATRMAARAVVDVLPCTGVRVWISSGRSAGQEIPHLHVHVLPCRSTMDRLMAVFPGVFPKRPYADRALARMAEPIRTRIHALAQP